MRRLYGRFVGGFPRKHDNDAVRHDDKFIQIHVFVVRRNLLPESESHFPDLIQTEGMSLNGSKKLPHALAANGHEIPGRLAVIPTP
jgi:hypothetical protein